MVYEALNLVHETSKFVELLKRNMYPKIVLIFNILILFLILKQFIY
jgi:hypothetical protein